MASIASVTNRPIKVIVSFVKNHQILVIAWLIVLLSLFLRLWQLGHLPHNLSLLEIDNLNKIGDLTYHGWAIPGHDIFTAIYFYSFGFWVRVFGFNIFFLKVLQAILGTLTVYVFYLFTKEWFNRQVALFSSLFLAVDAFHIAISREIEPIILVPLVLVLMLYVITLAIKTGKFSWFAIGGVVCGTSLYTNKFFFFLPLVFIVSFVFFFRQNKRIFTAFWNKYIVFMITFLITAVPYILLLPQNINNLLDSFNPHSFGNYFMHLGDIVQSLLYQSLKAPLYYVGLEPILSPFLAIAFVCGLLYAVFHLERRKYFFLVMLLVVTVGILALASNQDPLNYVVLLPICFILGSIVLDYFLTIWLKTFPFNRSARIALAFLLSFFIFLTVYYNFDKYFSAWGKNDMIQGQFNEQFKYKK